MKKELNWAVLGCGVIANEMAQALEHMGKHLYAVGNRTHEKEVAFAEKYGVQKVYGYDNLIGKLRALGAGISCDMDEADGDDTPPPPCTKVRSAAHVMPR